MKAYNIHFYTRDYVNQIDGQLHKLCRQLIYFIRLFRCYQYGAHSNGQINPD